MKIALHPFPAPGVFLAVKERRGPYNIRQHVRGLPRVPLKQTETGRLPPEDPRQFRGMTLTHPQKVDDLLIEVVEHFNLRPRLVKEHLRPTRKRLDVGRMGWNQ